MRMDREGWGWIFVFAMVGAIFAATLVVIALVASLLVPVELPIGVFAVLTGVVLESVVFLSPANGLFPDSENGGIAVGVLAGAVWTTGVFALSTVLGPGPFFVAAVLVALAIACFVLATVGGWVGVKSDAANRAAGEAKLLRSWASGLAVDPELAERLRAEGWRADGPIDESRATYLRVWEALKRERRAEGRPVWPNPRQSDPVEQRGTTKAVPDDPGAGAPPPDARDS